MAKGSENHRSAPNASAASRALCSLRVVTAASFTPGRPMTAQTCDTFAQPGLLSAPTIPTRSSFSVSTELRRISCRFLTIMLVLPYRFDLKDLLPEEHFSDQPPRSGFAIQFEVLTTARSEPAARRGARLLSTCHEPGLFRAANAASRPNIVIHRHYPCDRPSCHPT